MRVEDGLSAHFLQPDGPSKPGTDWRIGLKRGDETHSVIVRTYLADDLASTLQKDSEYQASVAMEYLNDVLNDGWHPADPRELIITLTNPPDAAPKSEKKPFWKFW
jgi:hypothetical protein